MFKRFTSGMAVGYVLGARAGQKRYEQLTELAERAMEIPYVERLVQHAQEVGSERGRQLLDAVRDRAGNQGDDDDDDDDEEVEGEYDDGDVEADTDDDVEDDTDDDVEDDTDDDVEDDVEDEYGDAGEDDDDEVEGDDDDGESGPGRKSEPRSRLAGLAAAVRERGRVA